MVAHHWKSGLNGTDSNAGDDFGYRPNVPDIGRELDRDGLQTSGSYHCELLSTHDQQDDKDTQDGILSSDPIRHPLHGELANDQSGTAKR